MSLELLLDQFDHLIQTPADVGKLRVKILDLAIQGLLVVQSPNDEPASMQLEQVVVEKKRLMKGGKNSGSRVSDVAHEGERPFDIPEGWTWAILGNLGITLTGTTPPTQNPEFFGNDYPFIKPADITDSHINYENEGLSSLGIERGRLVPAHSVLMVCIGGSIGKVGLVDRDCSCNQQINALFPLGGISSQYLAYAMQSTYFQNEVLSRAPQSTLPILSKGKWEKIPLPIPPLNAQKRIVEKIDELFAQTQQLAQRLQSADHRRRRFHTAALHQLTTAPTPAAATAAWDHLAPHFHQLYTDPDAITQLKQAILQLAVSGRLVPQDPNDEPAAVLLERINRRNLEIKEQKGIRASKPFPCVELDEQPYTVPSTWEWVRIDHINYQVTDGTHHTPLYVEQGIPFLSVKDISGGTIDFSNTKFVTLEQHQELIKRCNPEYGDVLLTKVGTTGIAKVVDTLREFSIFVSVALLKFAQEYVDPLYLELVINSPLVKEQSARFTMGVGNQNLVLKHIKNFVIPLPPYQEQKRIVEKVNELMEISAMLQQQAASAETARQHLLNALLTT